MNANKLVEALHKMQDKMPYELDKETKKLFDAIMKIADERDDALIDLRWYKFLLKENSNKAKYVLEILDYDRQEAEKLLQEIAMSEGETDNAKR